MAAIVKHDCRKGPGRTDGVQEINRLFVVVFDIEPLERDAVAAHKIAQFMGLWGPPGAEEPDAAEGRTVVGHPVREQVVEDGVEVFFGRRPGFEEVEIRASRVDGFDGRVGVGVGGQQDAFGAGKDFGRVGEEFGALHAGHTLIGKKKSGCIIPELELTESFEGGRTRIGTDDAVFLPVASAKVAFNSAKNFRLIIDNEDYWFRHADRSNGIRCRSRNSDASFSDGSDIEK